MEVPTEKDPEVPEGDARSFEKSAWIILRANSSICLIRWKSDGCPKIVLKWQAEKPSADKDTRLLT
jgi:hypothetical protein